MFTVAFLRRSQAKIAVLLMAALLLPSISFVGVANAEVGAVGGYEGYGGDWGGSSGDSSPSPSPSGGGSSPSTPDSPSGEYGGYDANSDPNSYNSGGGGGFQPDADPNSYNNQSGGGGAGGSYGDTSSGNDTTPPGGDSFSGLGGFNGGHSQPAEYDPSGIANDAANRALELGISGAPEKAPNLQGVLDSAAAKTFSPFDNVPIPMARPDLEQQVPSAKAPGPVAEIKDTVFTLNQNGTYTGKQTGEIYDAIDVPRSQEIADVVRPGLAGQEVTITLDVTNNRAGDISVFDTKTGEQYDPVDIPNSIVDSKSFASLSAASVIGIGGVSLTEAQKEAVAMIIAGETEAIGRREFVRDFKTFGLDYAMKNNPEFVKNAAVEINSLMNRTFAETGVPKSRVAGDIVATAYAKSQYTSLENGSAKANYDLAKAAYDALAGALTDGTVAKSLGFNSAVPAPSADHYHATYVSPEWSTDPSMTKVSDKPIGDHYVYNSGKLYEGNMLGKVGGFDVMAAIPTSRAENTDIVVASNDNSLQSGQNITRSVQIDYAPNDNTDITNREREYERSQTEDPQQAAITIDDVVNLAPQINTETAKNNPSGSGATGVPDFETDRPNGTGNVTPDIEVASLPSNTNADLLGAREVPSVQVPDADDSFWQSAIDRVASMFTTDEPQSPTEIATQNQTSQRSLTVQELSDARQAVNPPFTEEQVENMRQTAQPREVVEKASAQFWEQALNTLSLGNWFAGVENLAENVISLNDDKLSNRELGVAPVNEEPESHVEIAKQVTPPEYFLEARQRQADEDTSLTAEDIEKMREQVQIAEKAFSDQTKTAAIEEDMESYWAEALDKLAGIFPDGAPPTQEVAQIEDVEAPQNAPNASNENGIMADVKEAALDLLSAVGLGPQEPQVVADIESREERVTRGLTPEVTTNPEEEVEAMEETWFDKVADQIYNGTRAVVEVAKTAIGLGQASDPNELNEIAYTPPAFDPNSVNTVTYEQTNEPQNIEASNREAQLEAEEQFANMQADYPTPEPNTVTNNNEQVAQKVPTVVQDELKTNDPANPARRDISDEEEIEVTGLSTHEENALKNAEGLFNDGTLEEELEDANKFTGIEVIDKPIAVVRDFARSVGLIDTPNTTNISDDGGNSTDCQTNPTLCNDAPQPSYIPVTVTINEQLKEILLARTDLLETISESASGLTDIDEAEVRQIEATLNETPLVFDDDGKIVYSNGLYSPPINYSNEDESTNNQMDYEPAYVYLVEYVNENGKVIKAETNDESIPGNFATNLIKAVFSNNEPFNLLDVSSISYKLVDPKPEVPSDEYYDYLIKLDDGSIRTTTIPEFTSVTFMEEQFAKTGFEGDVIALINKATELPMEPRNEPGLVRKLMSKIGDTFTNFTNALFEDETETSELTTVLPTVEGYQFDVSDLRSVFIYPNAEVPCPNTPYHFDGYVYIAVFNHRDVNNRVTTVTEARCGIGDPMTLVSETAHHLANTYGITDANFESIVDLTYFNLNPIYYTTGVATGDIIVSQEKTSTGTSLEITSPSSDNESIFIPNTSNTVNFDVKATDVNGKILADWIAGDLEVTRGVELYFRWDGRDYDQCLPFLNDGGNYSLTRIGSADMTTGNTEAEGFNVREYSGTYRIECGGQKNGEFGVDVREIDVLLSN